MRVGQAAAPALEPQSFYATHAEGRQAQPRDGGENGSYRSFCIKAGFRHTPR